jgi:hypothetical protein
MQKINAPQFGDLKTNLNKSYIDYFINEITKHNKLSEEENKLIKHAKIKYSLFCALNCFYLLYSSKRLYKKGLSINYASSSNHDLGVYSYTIIFNILVMTSIYFLAQNIYYNDLKYLIRKYSFIDENKYKEAKRNRMIMQEYQKQNNNNNNNNINKI